MGRMKRELFVCTHQRPRSAHSTKHDIHATKCQTPD